MIKVHTRKQVMYQLDIGSKHFKFNSSHPAMRQLALDVSKVVGGCTIIDCKGYWAEVEKANKDNYSMYNVGIENNVQLQVKGEVEKESELEEAIVKSVVSVARKYLGLDLNWICGHKVQADGTIVAFNFSVKENL